jgi:hypothetical protein
MDMGTLLRQTGALDAISRELGMNPASAQAGAEALLPAILGGFKNQAQPTAGGLDGLAGMLGGLGGGALLEAVTAKAPTPAAPGNEILGQIFGSKDVSRAVAAKASQVTGLDPELLKKMLPLLAMAAAGYMASSRGGAPAAGGGGLGGLLGQVLGGAMGGGRAKAGQAGGLGGLAAMIDLNGDGNPLDDIMGMAGKLKK